MGGKERVFFSLRRIDNNPPWSWSVGRLASWLAGWTGARSLGVQAAMGEFTLISLFFDISKKRRKGVRTPLLRPTPLFFSVLLQY